MDGVLSRSPACPWKIVFQNNRDSLWQQSKLYKITCETLMNVTVGNSREKFD